MSPSCLEKLIFSRILEGIDKDDFLNLKNRYEETARENEEYLLKPFSGVQEFKIYCDMLEIYS